MKPQFEQWTDEYKADVLARIMSYLELQSNGCENWTASMPGGQPQIGGVFQGNRWMAKARVVRWRLERGVIPRAHHLALTCQNKACLNLRHIAIVTAKQFTAAALAAQHRPTRETDIARLMMYVKKAENGCWLWTGATIGPQGYGTFWLDQKQIPAHRASYFLLKGPLLPGLVVMHSCDDRQCVNPEHLSLGSHEDNMQDMAQKGRSTRGERNGQAGVLTDADVRLLKGEYVPKRDGELVRLAVKYCTTVSAISQIVSGLSWKHVDVKLGSTPSNDPPHRRATWGENAPKARLTNKTVLLIKTVWQCVKHNAPKALRGFKAFLAERYDVDRSTLSDIFYGRSWRDVVSPSAHFTIAVGGPDDFEQAVMLTEKFLQERLN